jgi:hypothetical protein
MRRTAASTEGKDAGATPVDPAVAALLTRSVKASGVPSTVKDQTVLAAVATVMDAARSVEEAG